MARLLILRDSRLTVWRRAGNRYSSFGNGALPCGPMSSDGAAFIREYCQTLVQLSSLKRSRPRQEGLPALAESPNR
jgi:hypothetical protein